MCIRDSFGAYRNLTSPFGIFGLPPLVQPAVNTARETRLFDCLLYTSDAADERSSVDLGGRRIIKKKINCSESGNLTIYKNAEAQANTETVHVKIKEGTIQ